MRPAILANTFKTSIRSFSSSIYAGSAKRQFVCIIPDKPGMLQKRLEIRPRHLVKALDLHAKGLILSGGAFTDKHPEGDETFNVKGSVVTFSVGSEAELRKILEDDVYTKEGVWDLDNIQIIPSIEAVRKN